MKTRILSMEDMFKMLPAWVITGFGFWMVTTMFPLDPMQMGFAGGNIYVGIFIVALFYGWGMWMIAHFLYPVLGIKIGVKKK